MNTIRSQGEFLESGVYKSYSHEASISYMANLGFSISEINKVDMLRKARNGIKYYGEDATENKAQEAIKTAEEMTKKFLEKKPKLKQRSEERRVGKECRSRWS